jgi:hypothetical protein
LDAGEPSWDHFGRVLAAGGPATARRLKEEKSPRLSAAAQARLLEAAQRAAGADRLDTKP